MNEHNEFDFGLKPKRPLWKDVLLFVMTVGSVWGMTHVALNYQAFAQITKFRMEKLQASVLDLIQNTEKSEQAQTLVLEKINPTPKRIFRRQNLKPRNQAQKMFSAMDVYPSDNRLYIPSIDKNVPLVQVPTHRNWQQLEKNIQNGLRDGVVVHPVSRAPGNFGNFFVTGHSSYYTWDSGRFKDVFALLHEVEPGEKVEVYWEGRRYIYQLQEKKVVLPSQTDVLQQPNNKSILTLMTCTPVGTNKKRLILVGELVEEGVEKTVASPDSDSDSDSEDSVRPRVSLSS
ncbi:sortase [Candidatus Gracilibacteria bacterium]|nr:sortase [Candidatus Gracilibacteria bacterium]MCF7819736.1 sortase [Candidatus Gracilibacteria bacterium]